MCMSHLAAVRGITPATTLAGLALLGSATAAAGAGTPTLEELKNATYQGIEGTSVTLVGGLWEGAPYEPGGVVRPILRDLAARTQVFLFTHHRHLVELTRTALPEGGAHYHELPANGS